MIIHYKCRCHIKVVFITNNIKSLLCKHVILFHIYLIINNIGSKRHNIYLDKIIISILFILILNHN